MRFTRGKYGHRDLRCPLKTARETHKSEEITRKEDNNGENSNIQKDEQRSSFGPWMVAQRTRRRSARMYKGNSINQPKTGAKISGGDQGESFLLPNNTPSNMTLRMKGKSSHQNNQGSRFAVLGDQIEMEIDLGASTEVVETEEGHQNRLEGVKSRGEVEMKTLESREGNTDMVRINVSHVGLAANLRSLGGTTTGVLSQAHSKYGGPRKTKEKARPSRMSWISLRPGLLI